MKSNLQSFSAIAFTVLSLSIAFDIGVSSKGYSQTPPTAPTTGTPPEDLPVQPVDGTAPAADGVTISDIQVRFFNRRGQPTAGRTQPYIITREFDLRPGDVYSQAAAQKGIERLINLESINRANVTLEPTSVPNQQVMVVNVIEKSPIGFTFDTTASPPSALQGPFQPRPVEAGPDIDSGFSVGGTAVLRDIGGLDQTLAARLTVGEQVLNGEISFTNPWIGGDPNRTGYAVNIFNQRAVQGVFTGGDRHVDLPNGENPWVHRLGGGVEVFRPITDDLTVALGASYQRVSIRDDYFTSRVRRVDELGNEFTFSRTGQDDLLTVNLAARLDQRNRVDDITYYGFIARAGIDQAIPIGDSQINFTRLSASYTQFIPLNLFGFARGPRTLILSAQGGHMFGDVPPYEAFDLTSSSVRGFGGDGIGTGKSFIELAAEYRYPIARFSVFRQPIDLRGSLFVDYASDLGTGDEVLGRPSVVRDKPGDSIGFGFGVLAETPIGLTRLEIGFDDNGGSNVSFSVGDRF
jgi:outer membrane protein insertion porin family